MSGSGWRRHEVTISRNSSRSNRRWFPFSILLTRSRWPVELGRVKSATEIDLDLCPRAASLPVEDRNGAETNIPRIPVLVDHVLQFSIVSHHWPTSGRNPVLSFRFWPIELSEFHHLRGWGGREGEDAFLSYHRNVLPRCFRRWSPAPRRFWVPVSTRQQRTLVSRLNVLLTVAYHDLRRRCGGLEGFLQRLCSNQSTIRGLSEPESSCLIPSNCGSSCHGLFTVVLCDTSFQITCSVSFRTEKDVYSHIDVELGTYTHC